MILEYIFLYLMNPVSTTCKLFYFYKNDSGIYFSLFDESCNWLLLLFTKLYTKLNKSTTLQKIIFVLYSYFFCSFFVAPNLQSVARFSLCLSMYVEKWVCRNTSWASHRKRSCLLFALNILWPWVICILIFVCVLQITLLFWTLLQHLLTFSGSRSVVDCLIS